MPRPYDATLKHLIEAYPSDWLQQLGLPVGKGIDVVDADLSTISTQSDKVLRVRAQPPWLAHIELQASQDDALVRRMLRYNSLLHDRHNLGVHSAVVLLRREADAADLTGGYRQAARSPTCWTEFHYQVVRLWEQPPELFLEGGLGTLPLTPLCAANRQSLPPLIRRMEERLQTEGQPAQRHELWAATFILMGLRYPAEFTSHLLRGVRNMKESVTYQAILQEGKAVGLQEGKAVGLQEGKAVGLQEGKAVGLQEGNLNEARRLVLRLGKRRFGPAPTKVKAAIESLAELDRLELLAERVMEANGWTELMAIKP